MMISSTATACLAVAATISAWSARSHAAGFAAARFGGEHGNVTATNPTALYFNPGAIGLTRGTHLFVDGTLAFRNATWEHVPAPTDQPDPSGAEGANAGVARLSNVFGGPMVGASTRVGPLALGGAFSVPFGGRAHWSRNEKFANNPDFPLTADGVQRWHGIEGALTIMYFTAGAAVQLGRVSVGVSGNVIRSTVFTMQAKNPLGEQYVDSQREGRATLDVSGIHGSFGLGALIEVVERQFWLGVSYQAQPGLGPMKLQGTLTTVYQGGNAPFPADFHQALPDIVRIGGRLRPTEKFELRLSGDFTRWSVMQTQCAALEGTPCVIDSTGAIASGDSGALQNVRRYWRDTLAVRASGSVWVAPRVELFAGAGLETAATPDETLDPSLADSETLSGALGARVALGQSLYLAASYTHIYYFPRDNTGRSRLAEALPPTRRADGGGKYTQWIGLVNMNLELQF
jgi:long-chain fatty acid transport protein